MRKYLLVALLCIVSLVVIGCGTAEETEQEAEATTPAQVATEAPEAEAEATAVPTEEAAQEATEQEDEPEATEQEDDRRSSRNRKRKLLLKKPTQWKANTVPSCWPSLLSEPMDRALYS